MRRNDFSKRYEEVTALFDVKGRQLCDGCFFDDEPQGKHSVEGKDVCSSVVCSRAGGVVFKERPKEIREKHMTEEELFERYKLVDAIEVKRKRHTCFGCFFHKTGYWEYTVEHVAVCSSPYCKIKKTQKIFVKK